MDRLAATVIGFVRNFDWNSPEAFAAAAIIGALLFKRWIILFTVVTIMIIGANIERFFVLNYEFNNFTVTSSFVVYAVGAVTVGVMIFLSLFNR